MTDESHYKIESSKVDYHEEEYELVCPLEESTPLQSPGGAIPPVTDRHEKEGFSSPTTTDREDEDETEKRSCDDPEMVDDQITTISNETFTVAKSEFKVDDSPTKDLEFPTKIAIRPVNETKDDDAECEFKVTPRNVVASGSTNVEEIATKAQESPQLVRRLSRTETVRQDAMRLKSATLGRMGKLFRLRPPTPSGEPTSVTTTVTTMTTVTEATASSDQYGEQPSKKEKTNSLGRMLKLVDKDGAPKKLSIPHPRAGSLTRILRKGLSSGRDDNVLMCKPEDRSRGIFSRMLSQLRGRTGGGNLTAEPNLRLDPTLRTRPNLDLPPAKAPVTSRIVVSDPPSAKAAPSSCSSAPTSAGAPESE